MAKMLEVLMLDSCIAVGIKSNETIISKAKTDEPNALNCFYHLLTKNQLLLPKLLIQEQLFRLNFQLRLLTLLLALLLLLNYHLLLLG